MWTTLHRQRTHSECSNRGDVSLCDSCPCASSLSHLTKNHHFQSTMFADRQLLTEYLADAKHTQLQCCDECRASHYARAASYVIKLWLCNLKLQPTSASVLQSFRNLITRHSAVSRRMLILLKWIYLLLCRIKISGCCSYKYLSHSSHRFQGDKSASVKVT